MGKRILFISAHMPNKHAKYAGHKVAYQMLMEYVNQGSLVDVAIICSADEFESECLSGIKNVNVLYTEGLNSFHKIINIIFSDRIFPLKINSRYSTRFIRKITPLLERYDVIHFEFTHATAVLNSIRSYIKPHQEVIVTCHDILTQSSLRSGRNLINSLDTMSTFRYENDLFSKMSTVVVLNDKDQDLLTSLFSVDKKKIKVTPPVLSEFVSEVKLQRESASPEKALLFWGAMNRKENEDAVLAFWNLYQELVLEKGYMVYVVGANPTQKLLNLQSKDFIVTGFLEDPSEYFIKAQIGIVPLLSGAGIKLKTLEMLEAGIPVISTPLGAEGIPTNDLLQVCDLESFAKFL